MFLTDTQIGIEPEPERLAEVVLMASKVIGRFGIRPRVALLTHAEGGRQDEEDRRRAAAAIGILKARMPDLEVVAQVDIGAALSPQSDAGAAGGMQGAAANLLVMPNLAAAGIALGVMKRVGNAVDVGPILIGSRLPVHILSNSVSVRGIVNMTAMAAADAR